MEFRLEIIGKDLSRQTLGPSSRVNAGIKEAVSMVAASPGVERLYPTVGDAVKALTAFVSGNKGIINTRLQFALISEASTGRPVMRFKTSAGFFLSTENEDPIYAAELAALPGGQIFMRCSTPHP